MANVVAMEGSTLTNRALPLSVCCEYNAKIGCSLGFCISVANRLVFPIRPWAWQFDLKGG